MDPLVKAASYPMGGYVLRRLGLPAPSALARAAALTTPRLAGRHLVVNYAAAKSSHDVLGIALEALQDPHQGSYNFGSMYNASSYKPDTSQYKKNPQKNDSTDHFPYQPSEMEKGVHSDLVGGTKQKKDQDRSGFGTGYSSELNKPMSEQDRAQKDERQKRERGDDWQTGTGKLHEHEINERKLRERDLNKEQDRNPNKANTTIDYRDRQHHRDPTDKATWPSGLSETRDRELRERKEYEKKERVEEDKGWRSDVTGSLNDADQHRRERLDKDRHGDSKNPNQPKPEQPWKPSQMERDTDFYKQTPTGSDYTRSGTGGQGGHNRPGGSGGSNYGGSGGSNYGGSGGSGTGNNKDNDFGRPHSYNHGHGGGAGTGTGQRPGQMPGDGFGGGSGMGSGNAREEEIKEYVRDGNKQHKDKDSGTHIRNDPGNLGDTSKTQTGIPGVRNGSSMPGDFNRTDRNDDKRQQKRDEEYPGLTGKNTGTVGSSRDTGFERVPREHISGNDQADKVDEPDDWQRRKSQHASGQRMNDPFGAPYGLEGGAPKGAPYSASVTAKSALEKTKEVAGTVMEKAGTVMEKAETVLEKVVEGTGRLVDETKKIITGHKADSDSSHTSSHASHASSHGAGHHTGYRITKQDHGEKHVSLVLHALDISHPHQMVDVFPAWRDAIQDLPPESRVVIVHRSRHSPPEGVSHPTHAAAVEGLHGFAAAAAKEVGDRGITINTLSLRGKVDESVAASFMEPLAFLLTDQCSYVDCQTLEVFTDAKVDQACVKTEKPLSGKVAVVTGGARGIGESIVHRFEEEGAEVCAVDLPGTLSHYHYDTRALEKDITAVDAPNKLVDHLQKHFGKVDIMVHNAGINMEVPMDKMSHDDYERVVQVNMESIIKLDEAIFASKGLVAPGARWMFMSAISGLNPYPYQTNYGYSKAAMFGYSRAMSKHRPVEDMTVNVIAPGYIDTDMARQSSFVNRNVTKRMNALMQGGKPEDVASAATFLATPGAQGINGQVLRVCGGSLFGR